MAVICATVAQTPALTSDPIIGRATVIDGDTIEIAGERIRFNGIDAPESWQRCATAARVEYRCGKASAEALDAFLAFSRPCGRTVRRLMDGAQRMGAGLALISPGAHI